MAVFLPKIRTSVCCVRAINDCYCDGDEERLYLFIVIQAMNDCFLNICRQGITVSCMSGDKCLFLVMQAMNAFFLILLGVPALVLLAYQLKVGQSQVIFLMSQLSIPKTI
jgi:hypothetical protein